MRIDQTVRRASTRGARTQPSTSGTRVVCPRCWTSHYRHGKLHTTCPPGPRFALTPDELADITARARAQRIEEDIQAYAARKTL